MAKSDIASMTLPEIMEEMRDISEPAFRGKQVFRWLRQGANSFDEMSNIGRSTRETLRQRYYIAKTTVLRKQESADGTVKYLFRLYDGETVESVVMDYRHGKSICISTQVGCAMGCAFCASGADGLIRNLTASEMLMQIHTAGKDLNCRISNVVLMGMGEPLHNLRNVFRFLELVSHPEGLHIGMRHITISTCGIVDGIYRLMELNPQITLSVSLHAPSDELRSRIMPVNRKWGVTELIRACKDYVRKTNRRITFEYSLMRGFNDSDQCAVLLAKLLQGMLCHVNLIPVNRTDGEYRRSEDHRVKRFHEILGKNGINATVRRTLGADIDASCGQLRRLQIEGDTRYEDR